MSETASSPEDKDVVTGLPSELGFIESDELLELRDQIREAVAASNEEKVRELVSQYTLKGEKLVEQTQGDEFPKAQIGLIIAKALAWKEAGRTTVDYPSELYGALEYAEAMGFDGVAKTLREALDELGSPLIVTHSTVFIPKHEKDQLPSQKIAEILRELKENLGFDAETCDEIAAMPFEEAFEAAYSYLTQAGIDADEVLADFIEESRESDA